MNPCGYYNFHSLDYRLVSVYNWHKLWGSVVELDCEELVGRNEIWLKRKVFDISSALVSS